MSWNVNVIGTNAKQLSTLIHEETKHQEVPVQVYDLIDTQLNQTEVVEGFAIHVKTSGHFYKGAGSAQLDIAVLKIAAT